MNESRLLRRCGFEIVSVWSTPSRHSAGPEQVLGYLGRFTHRVAFANSRLISLPDAKVSFSKDYRQNRKAKFA
ncbi:transposase [Bradyrhizobium sp. ORS 111]|uniref:transposase n=1 Tax=Bradyrhizobium sp. ORS 111 TaxID=1685958 RepID=UPI00388CF96A